MKGWYKESYRHYLASKGIKTNRYYVSLADKTRSKLPLGQRKVGLVVGTPPQGLTELGAQKMSGEVDTAKKARRVARREFLNENVFQVVGSLEGTSPARKFKGNVRLSRAEDGTIWYSKDYGQSAGQWFPIFVDGIQSSNVEESLAFANRVRERDAGRELPGGGPETMSLKKTPVVELPSTKGGENWDELVKGLKGETYKMGGSSKTGVSIAISEPFFSSVLGKTVKYDESGTPMKKVKGKFDDWEYEYLNKDELRKFVKEQVEAEIKAAQALGHPGRRRGPVSELAKEIRLLKKEGRKAESWSEEDKKQKSEKIGLKKQKTPKSASWDEYLIQLRKGDALMAEAMALGKKDDFAGAMEKMHLAKKTYFEARQNYEGKNK